jgi:flagellar biosynthesis/type III secretory pathway protein FliH
MLEETLIEWRDTARKEGQREGQREGRREGRKEGQIEGKRQFLLQLLEQRFGALSPQVCRKVKVSSEKRLEELGKGVLVAGSLAEMGLE